MLRKKFDDDKKHHGHCGCDKCSRKKHHDKCHDDDKWNDKCHDDKHHDKFHDDDKRHDKFDDDKKEKGLLTEFDVDDRADVQNGLEDFDKKIGKVHVCIDDASDRVWLNASINWQPTNALEITIPFPPGQRENITGAFTSVQARFTIWRGNPSKFSHAEPICSFIDSATFNLTDLVLEPPVAGGGGPPEIVIGAGFAPVTTHFQCVDEDPECGNNTYFLTVERLPANGNGNGNGNGGSTAVVINVDGNNNTIDLCDGNGNGNGNGSGNGNGNGNDIDILSVVFTAAEIEDNKKH